MQYRHIISALFFCFLTVPALAQEKKTLTIAADSWCPINCAPPEKHLGVGIDLAKAIFEPLGYEIDYKIMPWGEALAKVRTGEVDAVIGASIYDDNALVFPRQSVYHVTDDFYVLKGKRWRFKDVSSLKRKTLGAIADYGYSELMTEYIKEHRGDGDVVQFATGDNALQENIKKLLNHKIDVIIETRPVMTYTLSRMHLGSRIVWAGSVPQAPVYLAFSPALPASKELARQFDIGIWQFIRDNKLHEFYNKYGLSLTDR